MTMASRVLAALVTAAMLLVGGCALSNPRTAATVGGVTISESQVDTLSQALSEATEGQLTPGSQRATVVSVLVASTLSQQVAAQKGVTVDPAERQALLATSEQLTALAADPVLTDFINGFVDSQLISSQVGKDAFLAAVQEIPVQVNPRYGSWNQELAGLSGDTGSLSEARAVRDGDAGRVTPPWASATRRSSG